MLKRNDRVVVVGGCQSCGCEGVVIETTHEKAKVRFDVPPTQSSCRDIWFRIQNLRLIPDFECNGNGEPSRQLFQLNWYNEDEQAFVRLTPDQIRLMKYLESVGVFDDVLEWNLASNFEIVDIQGLTNPSTSAIIKVSNERGA